MPSSIQRPKISYPLYILNAKQLRKNKHTTIIKTFENGKGGGVHHLKISK